MNTTDKGDSFEERAFASFRDELEKDLLYVPGKKSTIFRKKGYFSKDRQADIITDISIETWMSGAESYSLLTVIECKDYSSSVPVNDIEEFYAKVQQIAGAKLKAIFVTSGSLQSGALAYAKSKEIAIVRLLPTNQIRWLEHWEASGELNWMEPEIRDFRSAFINQNHIGTERDFYGIDGTECFGTLGAMLKQNIRKSI